MAWRQLRRSRLYPALLICATTLLAAGPVFWGIGIGPISQIMSVDGALFHFAYDEIDAWGMRMEQLRSNAEARARAGAAKIVYVHPQKTGEPLIFPLPFPGRRICADQAAGLSLTP